MGFRGRTTGRFDALLISVLLLLTAFVSLAASATGSSPAGSCDLVASTAGLDSNPGTLDRPVKTVQELVDLLSPGQTGCLRGTSAAAPFTENVMVMNKNSTGGSESSRITIRSYPGEIAKIKGRLDIADTANFLTFSQIVFDRGATGDPLNQASPRIDGDDIVFSDNNVSGAGAAPCFKIGPLPSALANHVTLERNRIHNCTEAVSANNTQLLLLRNNLIYDNSAWGLRLDPNGDASFVNRNILDGNSSGILMAGDATNVSSGNVIRGNIISNPSSTGWNVDSSWSPLNVPPWYSNFLGGDCAFASGTPYGAIRQSSGGFFVNNLAYGDPLYRNRGAKDFHIDSSSPCYSRTGDVAQIVDDGGGPTDAQASADNQKPNILFIVTDDQRAEGTVTPDVMPETVARLKNQGTDFTNAYVTTPLCCPSRSSILSGRYAHNHLVTTNGLLRPAARNLDQDATVQRYLQDSGYRTGIFGKFLNNWNLDENPKHWDRWGIFNTGYCPLNLNQDGTRTFVGPPNAPVPEPCQADWYGTNYVRDKAVEFIDQSESNDSQPWFLYLTPYAPHQRFVPEVKYGSATFPPYNQTEAQQEGLPGHNPIDDKPPWVRSWPRDPSMFDDNTGTRVKQLRTLRSVDDLVKRVTDELQARGEQDTLIVFLSDNGFAWNEHGLVSKEFPYTDSVRVPMVMRYAPYTVPGATDSRLVANIDLAPTALNAAGLSLTDLSNLVPKLDGFSLLTPGVSRSRMLTEAWGHGELAGVPGWASTRTDHYQYIENYAEDGATITFKEYYDLDSDPQELNNLYGGDGIPGTSDDLGTPPQSPTDLHDQLLKDRFCKGAECPPGNGASSPSDTQPPLVYLDVPSNNASVCCRVKLEADAYDNIGVQKVRFKVNGSVVAEDTTAPFEATWDATGLPFGQYLVEAEAVDAAGNSRTAASTVNLDGSDFQADNCVGTGCGAGRINGGDTMTYTFGAPVSPGSISPGWDGNAPADCSPTPQPPGCATVTLKGDLRNVMFDHDTLYLYRDVQGTTDPITQMGSVDLGDDDYVGYGVLVTWAHSPMQLSSDGRRLVVTVGPGQIAANGTGNTTAIWTNPFCGCEVRESAQATGADRDF